MLDLQQLMHTKLLALRSLDRILSSEAFKMIYESATEEQRDAVKLLIQDGDKLAIEQWMAAQEIKPYENMTVVELRQHARKLGVLNYHLLPKASLLSAIKHKGPINGKPAQGTHRIT